jgi:hypothetical protein
MTLPSATPPAMAREPGWYHVRLRFSDGSPTPWDIAHLDERRDWWVVDGELPHLCNFGKEERSFAEIGPRIPSPATPAPADPALAERLEHLLRETAAQFRFYADNHRAKGTHDGDDKACLNAAWASRLDSDGGAILSALRATPAAAGGGWNAAIEAAASAIETDDDLVANEMGDIDRFIARMAISRAATAIRALARPQQPPAGTTEVIRG